jgi:hypothetical protein
VGELLVVGEFVGRLVVGYDVGPAVVGEFVGRLVVGALVGFDDGKFVGTLVGLDDGKFVVGLYVVGFMVLFVDGVLIVGGGHVKFICVDFS